MTPAVLISPNKSSKTIGVANMPTVVKFIVMIPSIRIVLSLFLFTSFTLSAQTSFQKKMQTEFIMVENGGTIEIPEGNFKLNASLWLDGKENITIKGEGKNETILSFKNQTEGAEGIKITNAKNIRLEGLTVEDTKGDAIKTQDVDGIQFIDVAAVWTGKANKKNGAYGLYPVQCQNVLIDKCEAIGASDAGIYVGQSDKVIVRNSRAYHNVAGIEIENTTNADVYNNVAEENTGGILVFDLPDLIKKKGGNVRIYNNKIIRNNYKNFAPKGNIVATVPPGSGMIILATSDVEIFDNQIIGHKTFGASIASYYVAELPIKDQQYDPYPTRIHIHDNVFERKKQMPTLKNKMGVLAWLKFKRDLPDIIYDGIPNKEQWDGDRMKEAYQICIHDNNGATFANMDLANNAKNISRDTSVFDCKKEALPAVQLTTRK